MPGREQRVVVRRRYVDPQQGTSGSEFPDRGDAPVPAPCDRDQDRRVRQAFEMEDLARIQGELSDRPRALGVPDPHQMVTTDRDEVLRAVAWSDEEGKLLMGSLRPDPGLAV